ncbi:MAG: hypothetical protein MUC85_03570 [Anaerolineales bacterium]|nr:hypothetical protein [Anaerolineales bacterium]
MHRNCTRHRKTTHCSPLEKRKSHGSGLLYKRLHPLLNHEQVILAEDLENIHLANVRGGLKLWRLYEALQVL